MKKIILIMSLCVIILIPMNQVNTDTIDNNDTTISGAPIFSAMACSNLPSQPEEVVLEVIKLERIEPTSLNKAKILLDKTTERAAKANDLLNSLIALGYAEDHPAMVLARTEISNTESDLAYYTEIYNELQEKQKWENRKNEYPVATEIWLYLKNLGYNDYVCAGIMGNIMAEVGGQTLKIQHTLYSDSGYYYGMCQWSSSYKEVWDADLLTQCNFLANTIQYEIDTFGYIYSHGFNYNSFLNLTNEKDAALAFAATYERCGSTSWFIRQKNATVAYEYFTS